MSARHTFGAVTTAIATAFTIATLAVTATFGAAPAAAQTSAMATAIPTAWGEVVPGVGMVGDDWFVAGDDAAVQSAQVSALGVGPAGFASSLLGYDDFAAGATIPGGLTVRVVAGAHADEAASALTDVVTRLNASLDGRLALGATTSPRPVADREILVRVGLDGAPCAGGDVYACAGPTIVGSQIIHAEIWIDPRLWDSPDTAAASPWLVPAVLGHALGHALGLSHTEAPEVSGRRQMMDATLDDPIQATPGGGDALGLLSRVPPVRTRPFAWASPGDVALTMRWDIASASVPAVFRPSTGTWYVRGVLDGGQAFGGPGDIPVPGDMNGDGRDDLIVFRPSTGTWFADTNRDGVADAVVRFGGPGDIPRTADIDGDGRADLIVFRPSTGTWFIDTDRDGIADRVVQWASPGDVPCAGDFARAGHAQLCVFRPSTGTWYVQGVFDGGIGYASPGDVPTVGDWDGDGRSDLAVFRPAVATWFPRY